MRHRVYILASGHPTAYMSMEAVENNGRADIRITDRISEWGDASAESVRAAVDGMIARGITEANLYINSAGGDVFQTNEIINVLKKFSQVNITVGALAASAATRILAEYSGSAVAFSNSQFMIHKPKAWLSGNEDQISSSLKMLRNATLDYKQTYAQCSGKTQEEIEDYWSAGDHWMTAEEALKFGLINEVKPKKQQISASDVTLLAACGAPNVPNIPNNGNTNANMMDKDKLKSLLGLPADATDEQIEKAIANNKQKADATAEMESRLETQNRVKAEELIDNAILKEKKITADQRENWLKLAKADYDGTKAAIAALPAPVKPDTDPSTGTGATAHKNWTLEDYLEKDPETYEQLKIDNPEAAAELEKAYFGK